MNRGTRHSGIGPALLAAWSLLGLATMAVAESGAGAFTEWQLPRWATPLEAVEGSVRFEGVGSDAEVVCVYAYPNGSSGEVACTEDASTPDVYSFRIPGEWDAGLGDLSVAIEVRAGGKVLRSEERRVPMSYAEELDITGAAAEVLLYPLPDDAYVTRYIPCCNIYGGMTYAERIPVNPSPRRDGLPETLLTDFVHLNPDDLCESTMGLYFDFRFDPAAAKSGRPALYELQGDDTWKEVLSYAVDALAGTLTVHYPFGGTLVVGLAESSER